MRAGHRRHRGQCLQPGALDQPIRADHGYLKARLRPMCGLKSSVCPTRLRAALDALQLVKRDFLQLPPI